MVLTVSFALSLVTGLFVTIPDAMRKHRHQVERQRRGVRTTRLRRPHAAPFVFSGSLRPPHPAPTSVTIAKRPLLWARDGGVYGFDLGKSRRDLFLRQRLDR
jgi:hypothetical protein